MKTIVKSLVVAAAMAVAGSVSADVIADLNPYVGVDYQHAWMKPVGEKPNAWDVTDIAKKSYPGAAVYVGTKFNENFGVELGGNWARNKRKSTVTDNGVIYREDTKITRKGLHLDLVGSMPIADNTEVFATAGLGSVKVKFNQHDEAAATKHKFSAKQKVVARLGVGANYMITDMVGLRAKMGWENTSRLRVKDDADQQKLKVFKDTVTASVGAFVRF